LTIGGSPWFVAKEVSEILGYRDATNMVRNLDEDEKDTHNLSTLGGEQAVLIINESGLYSAILRSRRKEAKEFKRWVTSTVLPSIRQHGGYVRGQEGLSLDLLASMHLTIRENALPALREYDRLTAHDHWKSPHVREAYSEAAIQQVALRFDLPLSFARSLAGQGLNALS
jgi:prophage antirepressor-like protein